MKRTIPSYRSVSVTVGLACIFAGVLGILYGDIYWIFAINGFVVIEGILISFIGLVLGPNTQSMVQIESDESIHYWSHPSVKSALVLIPLGIMCLGASSSYIITAAYLIAVPHDGYYIPSAVVLVSGGYFCLKGVVRCWARQFTTYYVTNRKIVRERKFFAGRQQLDPSRRCQ